MSKPWEVDDGLWTRIEPLVLVVQRRYRHPGRRRLDGWQVFCRILFVVHTGIPWRFLPQELGFGSGMTCWRRLRDWNEAGVRQRLHELLLAELRTADMLVLSRAAVDSSHIRAMKRGPATDRSCGPSLSAAPDRSAGLCHDRRPRCGHGGRARCASSPGQCLRR